MKLNLNVKKIQQPCSTTPPKNSFNSDNGKINSPPTPTNDPTENTDIEKRSREPTLTKSDSQSSNLILDNINQKQSNDFAYLPSQSSRRSSRSTTTTNTDDDQYELVRKLPSNINNDSNHQTGTEIKPISSPEMLSSATSLSTNSLSSSDEDEQLVQTITTTTPDEKNSIIDEYTRLEPGEITAE